MASGYQDWIPDSPEVIARVKAEKAAAKAAKKAATRGLKKTEPLLVKTETVEAQPTEPVFTPNDLSRDALLDVAKRQGLDVKGNVSKETLVEKLKEMAKSPLTR
jgi:hypothetical protein